MEYALTEIGAKVLPLIEAIRNLDWAMRSK